MKIIKNTRYFVCLLLVFGMLTSTAMPVIGISNRDEYILSIPDGSYAESYCPHEFETYLKTGDLSKYEHECIIPLLELHVIPEDNYLSEINSTDKIESYTIYTEFGQKGNCGPGGCYMLTWIKDPAILPGPSLSGFCYTYYVVRKQFCVGCSTYTGVVEYDIYGGHYSGCAH